MTTPYDMPKKQGNLQKSQLSDEELIQAIHGSREKVHQSPPGTILLVDRLTNPTLSVINTPTEQKHQTRWAQERKGERDFNNICRSGSHELQRSMAEFEEKERKREDLKYKHDAFTE